MHQRTLSSSGNNNSGKARGEPGACNRRLAWSVAVTGGGRGGWQSPARVGGGHRRRRSVALNAFATIAANGGMMSATIVMMTAAVVEYRSTTAQDSTNKPIQIAISTK